MATIVYVREIGDVKEEFFIVVTRRESLACSRYRTEFESNNRGEKPLRTLCHGCKISG